MQIKVVAVRLSLTESIIILIEYGYKDSGCNALGTQDDNNKHITKKTRSELLLLNIRVKTKEELKSEIYALSACLWNHFIFQIK